MKFFKIFFLFLISLLTIVCIGAFILLKTFDLNRYLPQMTKTASNALGHDLTVGHAQLNVSSQGIILDVSHIRVADLDPAAGPIVEVDKVQVVLEMKPLIFERRIQFSNITMTGTKIRTADPKMPLSINVPSVRARVNDFSLTDKFSVTIDCSLASLVENIHIFAFVRLDTAHAKTSITDLVFTSDLAQLNINAIKIITPVSAQIPLPSSVSGKLMVKAPQVQAGPKGLESMDAHVEITDGSLKMEEILTTLTDLHVAADVNLADVQLRELSLHVGEGSVKAEGAIKDYAKSAQLIVQAKVNGIRIEDVVDVNVLPIALKGKVSGNIAVTGQGLDPQVLLKSIKGQGDVRLSDGVVEKLNILKIVLGSTLNMIPGLADSVENMITGKLKDQLGTDTVVLERAKAKFTIDQEIVSLDESSVVSKAFEASAKGTLGFDMKTDVQVTVLMAEDLSTELAKKVEQLGYLRDETNRIKINGQVAGIIPHVKFSPSADVKKITKGAMVEEGSKQLQKVIEKNPMVGDILNAVLGGSGQSDQSSPSESSAPQDGTDKTKKILSNVLDQIFQ